MLWDDLQPSNNPTKGFNKILVLSYIIYIYIYIYMYMYMYSQNYDHTTMHYYMDFFCMIT